MGSNSMKNFLEIGSSSVQVKNALAEVKDPINYYTKWSACNKEKYRTQYNI